MHTNRLYKSYRHNIVNKGCQSCQTAQMSIPDQYNSFNLTTLILTPHVFLTALTLYYPLNSQSTYQSLSTFIQSILWVQTPKHLQPAIHHIKENKVPNRKQHQITSRLVSPVNVTNIPLSSCLMLSQQHTSINSHIQRPKYTSYLPTLT